MIMSTNRLVSAVIAVVIAVIAVLCCVAMLANLRSDAGSGPGAKSVGQTPTATMIARGAYLARAGDCMACHTARGGLPYAGGKILTTAYGVIVSPNITPDKTTGLGLWSSDDFWQALHNGKSRDGQFLYPAFPFPDYTKITREDSDALYSYLMTVAPVRQASQEQQLRFPYNQRWLLRAWRMFYFKPGVYMADPGQSVAWNRGAYLVQGLGHCDACHSPRNILGASDTSATLTGSLVPTLDWYAPSLTSNAEAGIGKWADQDVAALLKTGVSGRGAVFGPMAEVVSRSLQHLSDSDIQAMVIYLKTLPQTDTAVPGAIDTSGEEFSKSLQLGAKVYDKHCADCHGAQGQGHGLVYPPLAGNPTLTMSSSVNPIRIVLNGGYPPSTDGNPRPYGMPPFANTLTGTEVVAVVNYIRNTWGNHAPPIGPDAVNQERGFATN